MGHGNKYLFFLIALAISLFSTTLGRLWANVFAGLLFLASLVVVIGYVSKSKLQRALLLGVALLTLMPWRLALGDSRVIETINTAIWGLLTFNVGRMIFRDINQAERIGSSQIYGIISIYLLIGMFFGLLYQLLLVFDPNALYFNVVNFKRVPPPNEGDVYYYSFITLSTVGYGDVSPASPIARAISVIEAIVGIMFVATMIARFVASHAPKESPPK